MADCDETEIDPQTYLFEGEQSEPRRAYAKNLDATWIGLKVRVRTGQTIIIEDTIIQIVHFSGTTRLYFKNARTAWLTPVLMFSQDKGYRVAGDELVEVIP